MNVKSNVDVAIIGGGIGGTGFLRSILSLR